MNNFHDANRKYWQAISPDWQTLRDQDGLWQTCHNHPETAFEPGVWEVIQRYAASLAGKRICVLGSGDNYAAFALAGLGAWVTSVDISQAQLDVAAERARQLRLDIQFIQGDISNMPLVSSGRFDLVCATNGVTVPLHSPNGNWRLTAHLLQLSLDSRRHPQRRHRLGAKVEPGRRGAQRPRRVLDGAGLHPRKRCRPLGLEKEPQSWPAGLARARG